MPSNTSLLPDLIIAGTNKAGTSSLWSYLGRHPGVAASAVKETGFFLPIFYTGEEMPPLSRYEEQWLGTDAGLLRMEATPAYFYGGHSMAQGIDEACPGVRILIMLREPSARLLSFLRFKQSMLQLPADLSLRHYVERCRAMSDEQLLRRDGRPWYGIAGGLYVEHLEGWYSVFGDRLRVVFFEDLIRDPRGVVTDTCDWLGLDLAAARELPLEAKNLTTGYRNATLQRVALKVNHVSTRFFGRHPALKAPLLTAYRRFNGAEVPRGEDPDEVEVMAELKDWYADQNAGLRDLLESHGVGSIPSWVS